MAIRRVDGDRVAYFEEYVEDAEAIAALELEAPSRSTAPVPWTACLDAGDSTQIAVYH